MVPTIDDLIALLSAMGGDINDLFDTAEDGLGALGALPGISPTLINSIRPRLAAKATGIQQKHAQLASLIKRLKSRQAPAVPGRCSAWAKDDRPLSAEELSKAYPVRASLFARVSIDGGAALSTSLVEDNGFKLFEVGYGDPAAKYGWGGGGTLSGYHTNMPQTGKLVSPSWFKLHGFAVEIEAADRTENVAADVRLFGAARLSFGMNGWKRVFTDFVSVAECPFENRLEQQAPAAAGATGVNYTGRPFWSETPLATLRAEERVGVRLRWPDELLAVNPSKAYVLTVHMTGFLGIVAGGE